MGSVTKVSPLPRCTHELAPSEPETAMCGVTVILEVLRSPAHLAAWAGLLQQCWSACGRPEDRMVLLLVPKATAPGGRVRGPRKKQSLEQGRQYFHLPPVRDCWLSRILSVSYSSLLGDMGVRGGSGALPFHVTLPGLSVGSLLTSSQPFSKATMSTVLPTFFPF